MDETARKRRALIAACLSYEASALHDEDHPENPHGDAEMELAEDILNRAVWDYCELFAERPGGA